MQANVERERPMMTLGDLEDLREENETLKNRVEELEEDLRYQESLGTRGAMEQEELLSTVDELRDLAGALYVLCGPFRDGEPTWRTSLRESAREHAPSGPKLAALSNALRSGGFPR